MTGRSGGLTGRSGKMSNLRASYFVELNDNISDDDKAKALEETNLIIRRIKE